MALKAASGGDGKGSSCVAPDPGASRRESYVGCPALGHKKTKVPRGPTQIAKAMFTDTWLHVNDSLGGGDDVAEQYMNENTQLGLINALLLTMAWSSFYGVMDMDSAWRDVNINTDVWVDVQVILFGIACMGFGFATVGSVLYLLAANEASTASKVYSMQAHFGPWASAPFYFFFTGLFGWGSGFYVQGCVATRTTTAFVVFLVVMLSATLVFIASMHRCVLGVFIVQRLSEDHRPVTKSLADVHAMFKRYAEEVGRDAITMHEFRLRLVPALGADNHYYWPGLSDLCQERVELVFREGMQRLIRSEQAAGAGGTCATLSLAAIRAEFKVYMARVGADNVQRKQFMYHLESCDAAAAAAATTAAAAANARGDVAAIAKADGGDGGGPVAVAGGSGGGGDAVAQWTELSEVCEARAAKVFMEQLSVIVNGEDDVTAVAPVRGEATAWAKRVHSVDMDEGDSSADA